MAYKITDKCISCGACAAQCPMECIAQGEDKYVYHVELAQEYVQLEHLRKNKINICLNKLLNV